VLTPKHHVPISQPHANSPFGIHRDDRGFGCQMKTDALLIGGRTVIDPDQTLRCDLDAAATMHSCECVLGLNVLI